MVHTVDEDAFVFQRTSTLNRIKVTAEDDSAPVARARCRSDASRSDIHTTVPHTGQDHAAVVIRRGRIGNVRQQSCCGIEGRIVDVIVGRQFNQSRCAQDLQQ